MNLDLKGWVIPTGIGVASFAIGIGAGFVIATRSRRNKTEVGEIKTEVSDLRSEVDESRADNVQLKFTFDDNERRVNNLLGQMAIVIERFHDEGRAYLDRNVDPELHISRNDHPSNKISEVVLEPISNEKEDEPMINVFRIEDEDDDGWDYAVEVPKRTPDHPYIIHRDEYMDNELDYDQSTLTFYVGDEILCDEQNVPVYNPDKIVGKIRFGYGSRDPSICYVRNEDLSAEYEILIDHGYYQQEVLGESIENNSLKHSRRPLKFRQE